MPKTKITYTGQDVFDFVNSYVLTPGRVSVCLGTLPMFNLCNLLNGGVEERRLRRGENHRKIK